MSSSRLVISNVPRFGCYGSEQGWNVEENPFPSCLRAFLQYKGELGEINTLVGNSDKWHKAYMNLMGASGATFRMLWKPGWGFGNTDLMAMHTNAMEPIKRSFECLGYSWDALIKKDYARQLRISRSTDGDEAAYTKRICDSLRAGNPVIAIGVVGPDFCMITGYDESRHALLGWSGFQDDPDATLGKDPSGYFVKTDWFKDTRAIFVIGDRKKAPALKETYVKSLELALEIMRRPQVRGVANGAAAYTAWSLDLRKDEYFPKDKLQTLKERYLVHKLSGLTVAEGRAWGAQYLRSIAEAYPCAARELRAASDCFNDEHDLVWAIWEFTGGDSWSDESAVKLADRGIRSRIAPLVALMGKLDTQAVGFIDKAVKLIERDRR